MERSDARKRLMFTFSLDGDLRFISHHDTVRLFRRACARAELPVRFSAGFNPQAKIMLPLPRPVGVASQAEAVVIETDRPIEPDEALRRLRRQMPAGLEIREVCELEPGRRPRPEQARYRLELEPPLPADLEKRIDHIRNAASLPVERTDHKGGETRSLDLRPYLLDIRAEGAVVEFTLRITGSGTARPAEIAAMLGCDPRAVNHRIRRMEIQWK